MTVAVRGGRPRLEQHPSGHWLRQLEAVEAYRAAHPVSDVEAAARFGLSLKALKLRRKRYRELFGSGCGAVAVPVGGR